MENGRNKKVIEIYCGLGEWNAGNCANRAGNVH